MEKIPEVSSFVFTLIASASSLVNTLKASIRVNKA